MRLVGRGERTEKEIPSGAGATANRRFHECHKVVLHQFEYAGKGERSGKAHKLTMNIPDNYEVGYRQTDKEEKKDECILYLLQVLPLPRRLVPPS